MLEKLEKGQQFILAPHTVGNIILGPLRIATFYEGQNTTLPILQTISTFDTYNAHYEICPINCRWYLYCTLFTHFLTIKQ